MGISSFFLSLSIITCFILSYSYLLLSSSNLLCQMIQSIRLFFYSYTIFYKSSFFLVYQFFNYYKSYCFIWLQRDCFNYQSFYGYWRRIITWFGDSRVKRLLVFYVGCYCSWMGYYFYFYTEETLLSFKLFPPSLLLTILYNYFLSFVSNMSPTFFPFLPVN